MWSGQTWTGRRDFMLCDFEAKDLPDLPEDVTDFSRGDYRNMALLDNEDTDRVRSSGTPLMSDPTLEIDDAPCRKIKSVDTLLDVLDQKSASRREEALMSLVDVFTNSLQNDFLENNCFTLLRQLVNSFKRGSSKEKCLASRVIGLMAVAVGCGDRGHEIFTESFSPISRALISGFDSSKLESMLDSLAIISFFGGLEEDEMEASLQIIWQLIHPKSDSNVVLGKPRTAVLTAALSAWAFVFTIMDGWRWRLQYKNWQGYISYILCLLDEDDESVRHAAASALAVVYDVGSLAEVAHDEPRDDWKQYSYIQGLKEKILNKITNLSMEDDGQGLVEKDIGRQSNFFSKLLLYLQDDYSSKDSVAVGDEDWINISTWSQMIQLRFLDRFLGGGFMKHMQENKILRDIFDFLPEPKEILVDEQDLSCMEKVVVKYFVRPPTSNFKRLYKSPNSDLSKARTLFMKRRRALVEPMMLD